MDVRASISPNAIVTVMEMIQANVEGRDIRRGIIRIFPTDYEDSRGRTYRTDFNLLYVKIDGRDAPAQVSRVGRNVEVRIGDANTTLSSGIHSFEIMYRTKGWVAFRDSYDELFWNVTGTDWDFPIDAASFGISLPGKVQPERATAFTGADGGRGTDFVMNPDGTVSTTRTLRPGEGFSVSYAWPKGIVGRPSGSFLENAENFIADYKLLVSIVFVMIVTLYYFGAWYMVGKDPAKGTVIPNWRPPEGVEPGFASCMRDMKYSQKCLVADIMQLAVKGFLYFEDDGGAIRIMPTEKATGAEAAKSLVELSPPLRNLANGLFMSAGKGGVLVKDVNGDVFNRVSALLESDYDKRVHKYYSHNVGYSIFGILLFIPMLIALVLNKGFSFNIGEMLGPLMYVAVMLLKAFNRSIKSAAIAVVVFLAVAVLLAFDFVLMCGIVVGAVVAFFFAWIMPARTPKGARLMTDIEGLAMYMGTAERHRLAMLNPPDETPKLFETLLPYAYALDCADTWVDGFADTLKAASFRPVWDRTMRYDAFDWAFFNSRVAIGLTRGINSSVNSYRVSQAKKSASYRGGGGFGGGGGVGGGGGGGGGRGW